MNYLSPKLITFPCPIGKMATMIFSKSLLLLRYSKEDKVIYESYMYITIYVQHCLERFKHG